MICLNRPLIYINAFSPLSPPFLLPLFNPVAKKNLFLGIKILEAICTPCPPPQSYAYGNWKPREPQQQQNTGNPGIQGNRASVSSNQSSHSVRRFACKVFDTFVRFETNEEYVASPYYQFSARFVPRESSCSMRTGGRT